MGYLRWRFLGLAFFLLVVSYRGFFNGIGHTKVFLWSAIIINLSNILFDWLFVFDKVGFPAKGLDGAGAAYALANLTGCIFFLGATFLQREVEQIAQDTGTTFSFTLTSDTVPAPTDTRVRRTIDEAAARLGLRRKSMPSGAGHDAQEMARLGPIGMIFVPSVGGISHSPREFTRPEDITNGTNVLLHAILGLDAER